jgi:peptidoglycan/xylan/chitin deacetylase (PgdA/CDA1 family)
MASNREWKVERVISEKWIVKCEVSKQSVKHHNLFADINSAFCFLLSTLFLLAACQSINQNRAETGVRPSTVILSFDDGPNANGDTTARLLDVLKKQNVKAVFSLLGENSERYPQLTKLIYDEGHCIVSHGYADKWAINMGNEEFRDNLAKGEAAINAALGHDWYPKLYRPHGGYYSSEQEKIMYEAGYALVPANVRIYDAVMTGADKAKAIKKIITEVDKQKGGIILLHDGKGSYRNMEKKLAKNSQGDFNRSWIPDVVEELIPVLLDKGYCIDLISNFTHY